MKVLTTCYFLLLYFLSFAQISWEGAVTIDTPYSKYIRTCKIERGQAAGDILLTYSDRQRGYTWRISTIGSLSYHCWWLYQHPV